MKAATRGHTIGEIAIAFNLSERQVSRILHTAAAEVRRQTAQVVAHAFNMQVKRLEHLYRVVNMEIEAYEEYMIAVRAAQGKGESLTPVKFDDRPFRVAVAICERQARLLNLDIGGLKTSARSPTAWIDNAPIDEVVEYAKQLKMKLPSEFQT